MIFHLSLIQFLDEPSSFLLKYFSETTEIAKRGRKIFLVVRFHLKQASAGDVHRGIRI